jgi:hypothetical protein
MLGLSNGVKVKINKMGSLGGWGERGLLKKDSKFNNSLALGFVPGWRK